MSAPAFVSRPVERLVRGVDTQDGAGVRLTRLLTPDLQRRLDPFLMLDAFGSDQPDDYIAGFPDHPHRGFETVTYMLAGRMRHRDNAGHEGLLQTGGVQWMTAGRGIVHSELPEQTDGLMEGFQLWLNLPAAGKMVAPGYRDIPATDIPTFTPAAGVTARLIAGRTLGHVGAVERPVTEPVCLDLELAAGSRLDIDLPSTHNAFAVVYAGEASVGGVPVAARQLAVLGGGDGRAGVALASTAAARVLVVAGRPLREPIAQWGPFVMSSRDEVEQAIDDFRAGRF